MVVSHATVYFHPRALIFTPELFLSPSPSGDHLVADRDHRQVVPLGDRDCAARVLEGGDDVVERPGQVQCAVEGQEHPVEKA